MYLADVSCIKKRTQYFNTTLNGSLAYSVVILSCVQHTEYLIYMFPLKLQICKTLSIIIILFCVPRLTVVKEKLFHVLKDVVGFQESTIEDDPLLHCTLTEELLYWRYLEYQMLLTVRTVVG